LDEKILILEKLKQLGISSWKEEGQVIVISYEDNNDGNIKPLNN
jgi:hypothetical protein